MKTLSLFLLLGILAHGGRADTLIAFTPQGFTKGGPSPWDETTAPNTITMHQDVELTSGLQRGPGIAAGGTAEAWGGSGWTSTKKDEAIGQEDYFALTVAPKTNETLSFSQINATFFRGENSASTYLWQYQIGAGPFVDIGQPAAISATTVKGIPQDAVNLSTISELQNVTHPVTFRMIGWGAASKGASWGFGRTTGAPVLSIEGTAVTP